ncbi:MAG TPA: RNase adapter RapZ [Candidatus Avidehalobacter gallistercoris]|uniref:RNase adapter RapZ n=1 Tax=Candidatus Avidehalobacter gallistercoris TaxID=2840694 RepID=A0A9D1KX42_9FIRM|nr:RNase adapter RapZ [Candidatus Avidehalobacter gallistercoris]
MIICTQRNSNTFSRGAGALELKIVTGMSGAGKTNLVQVLEDMGYYCVDNLPPNLFLKFVELILQVQADFSRVALVADVRGGKFFQDVYGVLQEMKNKGIDYEIIFLEASDEALVRRFKETRRRHPLAKSGSVLEGIREERKRLQRIRGLADIIIDTSGMRVQDFKQQVADMLGEGDDERLLVNVISFGFKYGLPIDVDMVMDVRFLPNPFYVAELKPQTGLDAPVRDYVIERAETQSFLDKYCAMLAEIMPQYLTEGKHHLSLAVGCTGGQHRSVAMAEEIGRRLSAAVSCAKVRVGHRDLSRG